MTSLVSNDQLMIVDNTRKGTHLQIFENWRELVIATLHKLDLNDLQVIAEKTLPDCIKDKTERV